MMRFLPFLISVPLFCLFILGINWRSVKLLSLMPADHIIPVPAFLEAKDGLFRLTSQTVIIADTENEEVFRVVEYMRERFLASGLDPEIRTYEDEYPEGAIFFSIHPEASKNPEGYSLSVSPERVFLSASAPAGLFYGVQTLFQLMPAEIYAEKKIQGSPDWLIPCVEIIDEPRFKWRGMMLDVSRHFSSAEFIYDLIDYLAMHKCNIFHWHLVDDQGWRIEIKKYPKLTETGAWRADRKGIHWNAREKQKPGEKPAYGGYYTQEEIRDIVAYAKSRFITIVPEIEMPAHVSSAIASYPHLSCRGDSIAVPTGGIWPLTDIYCAGNDSVFQFLEDVLSEVMSLFPGEYIHIGGDEATKTEWKNCPKCQERIVQEELADEQELQSYFIRRMERFLSAKGRKLIGWDEILEGGLAPGAAVMSWRGMEGGIEAVKTGHYAVMSPTSHCYFDYYQGDPQFEPLAIGGYLPLSTVYSFEPVPEELTESEAEYILGCQANLWTEYVPDRDHAEYMIFPRLAALAEAAWSQKERRDWDHFRQRLISQLARYTAAGIHYSPSAFQVRVESSMHADKQGIILNMATELAGPSIHYTRDGSEPGTGTPVYSEPVFIDEIAVVKAAAFLDGKQAGPAAEYFFPVHMATGIIPEFEHQPSSMYPGKGPVTLTNGTKGSISFKDGQWLGFRGDDMIATLDMTEEKMISSIEVGGLQAAGSWVFLPEKVEIFLSSDGNTFHSAAVIKNPVDPRTYEPVVHAFKAEFEGITARYLRIHAKNIGDCPPWHSGAGGKAWLFCDEIIIL